MSKRFGLLAATAATALAFGFATTGAS
ncbi:MAG: hypothetical protein QOG74_3434, partial [Alphaproteobacteria bacterium]|nr:hypothetical protein [Alphaproteobacteria bacterium]